MSGWKRVEEAFKAAAQIGGLAMKELGKAPTERPPRRIDRPALCTRSQVAGVYCARPDGHEGPCVTMREPDARVRD